jgi:hypothetical protein
VLRRYEPLQRESANAVIEERAKADPAMTRSQRWALTGSNGEGAQQAPLGRRTGAEPPRELDGVRYRWDPAPATNRSGGNGGGDGETNASSTETVTETR